MNKKNRLVQKAAYGPKNPKGHEIDEPDRNLNWVKELLELLALQVKPLLIADTTKDRALYS